MIHPQLGGVERVTYTLANYFESKNYCVFFLCINVLNSKKDIRQYVLPDSNKLFSEINVDYFKSFIIEKSIDIVINQGGTICDLSKFIFDHKIDGVKYISVLHNSPLASVKNFSTTYKNKFRNYQLDWLLPITQIKSIKFFLLRIYRLKYGKHYKMLCRKSDLIVLLSEKYKEELSFFAKKIPLNNVISIPNPISFNNIVQTKKKKELLYVGRINSSQKRIDLLLYIWEKLHYKFSDWCLNIVGDGDELFAIKNLSLQLKLKNINFFGFCDPRKFYETASIFCLTSSFEGLPMSLIESMQFGVVPVAFNSFDAITDIIEDKVNGVLVVPFDVEGYAEEVSKLICSQRDLIMFSNNAKIKSKIFDLSNIGDQWIYNFNS